MKHLTALLLILLLLCGCAREVPAEETAPPTTEAATIPTTSPPGLYAPGSEVETSTGGAIRAYPLNMPMVNGMHAFAGGLLVFSGEEATTLTLLTGEELHITASTELDFLLDGRDPSLRICGSELSYFDPVNRETVVLNSALKQVSHIAAPEDLAGSPVLSEDRNTLYYCTSTAVRAWDLETGIRRTIKEMAYADQTVSALHLNDTILQCLAEGRSLFLAADTGRLVYEWEHDISLTTCGDRYYATFPLGLNQTQVFGEGETVQMLLPRDLSAECVFLAEEQAMVSICAPADNEILLEYYDLPTGTRHSAITLKSGQVPSAFASADGSVYFLLYSEDYGCDTIYRWDTRQVTVSDETDYTGSYTPKDAPDHDGLARCQAYADQIGEKHGIEILVWEAAAAVQPWDYDLEPEYLVSVIWRELELLEARLDQYPQGILADTASNFTSLKLCLVRSVTGTAESGSLNAATGVQFFKGSDAYVAIVSGKYAEQALYHELFHVMETHIFNNSIAFDQWDALNPAGFEYDYGYSANETRNSGVYLSAENRAFVDTYSMSFPKEDRARIMEYAMLVGKESVFESKAMQAKLTKLCEGIREAYGVEDAEETFLWEQYLK